MTTASSTSIHPMEWYVPVTRARRCIYVLSVGTPNAPFILHISHTIPLYNLSPCIWQLNLAFQPIRYPPEPKRRKGASTKGLFTPLHLHWHHWSASPGKSDVYHPVRQYLHMGSLEKMLIGEWMLHLDDSCEQVEDSDWLRKLDRAVRMDK